MAQDKKLNRICFVIATTTLFYIPLNGQDRWQTPPMRESDYEALWDLNPFNRKTETVEAKTGPSFADDWSLAGISVIGKKQRVLMVNRKTRKYQSVSNQDDGDLTLVKINTHADRSQVTAVIAKGGVEAEVKFDSRLIKNIADQRNTQDREKEKQKNAARNAASADNGAESSEKSKEGKADKPKSMGDQIMKGVQKASKNYESKIKLPSDVLSQPKSGN